MALEALARDEAGGTDGLYERDAGESLPASFVRWWLPRGLCGIGMNGPIAAADCSRDRQAPAGSDGRVAGGGALEARLQRSGTLIVGGLNEGSWPRGPTDVSYRA